jgi:DtxR family Mn-dependent transcriptional regulator
VKIKKNLTPKLEDYLITVYRLERERRVARSRDIGRRQGVAKSTVTAALQSLAGKGLINYEPYETITLTPAGRKQAEWLIIRNRVLRDFLENVLGLGSEEVRSTACGLEHALNPEVTERFACFMAFLKLHGKDDPKWLREFHECAGKGGQSDICADCVQKYLESLKATGYDNRDRGVRDT